MLPALLADSPSGFLACTSTCPASSSGPSAVRKASRGLPGLQIGDAKELAVDVETLLSYMSPIQHLITSCLVRPMKVP